MSDKDFLAQIQAAEKENEESIEKAHRKADSDLQAYTKKLNDKKETNVKTAREAAKEKIKNRQVEARKVYEAKTQEGTRESAQIEKELTGKLEKQVKLAETYFVSEVLS